jgi:hypothetical protein
VAPPLSTDLVRVGSTGLVRTQQPRHPFSAGVAAILDLIE